MEIVLVVYFTDIVHSQVACGSKNALVKGACGVGLGFSCQDLLTRFEAVNDSNLGQETFKMQEVDLLGKIVRALSQMICQLTQSSSDLLESLSSYFPLNTYDMGTVMTSELSSKNSDDLEEDIWGVAGLVLGLGSSVNAIYRAGAHEAVLKIKDLIISWIPHVNPSVQNSSFHDERSEIVLSVGSCLALPIVVAFCQRVELVNNSELDHIVGGYMELISELVSVKKSGTFHESLLMASCTGVGSLLACILNEGVHPLEVEFVKGLLELLRKSYSNPYPPIIHFGGMLGVVNALGAGAGTLMHSYPLMISLQTGYEQKESSYIMGPLLSSPACEPHLASLMQEIFLVAQNSDDHQQQQYAAWAISFLRHRLWSKEPKELQNFGHHFQTDADGSKSVSQSFSEDSTVMKLSLWLMQLNYSGVGPFPLVLYKSPFILALLNLRHTNYLRCLSQAPRLPALDWGAIIRRCMRYEAQVSELIPLDSNLKKVTLREECLQFSLAHANQFDSLLSFLDEIAELSRFSSLELNLQSHLLSHLEDLIKIFSGSRLEKLFDDITVYLSSSVSSHQGYNPGQQSLLRVSCWKGLDHCLDEASVDSLQYITNIEKCMEVLFSLLPAVQSGGILGVDQVDSKEEWSEAINCLGKSRRGWLLDLLQVLEADLVQGDDHFIQVAKRFNQVFELFKSAGIWDVLIEVVEALQHAEGIVKRQWLVDTIEISCITNYPSTLLSVNNDASVLFLPILRVINLVSWNYLEADKQALQFLGLLSGSCCKYMPFLILDRFTVLSDLPVTLTSLLSEPNWEFVAESVVSRLWTLTERIYNWATHISHADDSYSSSLHSIDKSENAMAAFLTHLMYHTCVSLKDYLPLESNSGLQHDSTLRFEQLFCEKNAAFVIFSFDLKWSFLLTCRATLDPPLV
ncbi:Protein RST1 [Vitis vinifera]|uniref:Protein RST1 n=1 Tax=Vitis vinifera TaxID=29760 RepID=A0A438EG04_VITVI|nr:Protein RST1 [Vitis vinifera]